MTSSRTTAKPKANRQTAELASALRPAVLRLARRLRQLRDESLELGPTQLGVLSTLCRQGPLLVGELAAYEKVQPPSMTRTVNSLQTAGLVTRQVQQTDRRQALIAVTDRGREVVLADRRRRDAWLAQRLAALELDADTVRRVTEVLEAINE